MAEHLEHSTGAGRLVEHQDGEQHEAAVRHGTVGVDVLEVGLHTGAEGTVDHGDAREDEEYPTELVGSLGHEVHGNAEAAVATQLHEYAGMQHRHGRGGRSVTVGAPCVEGEEGSEHTETDEGEGEPEALLGKGNGMGAARVVGNLDNVHGLATGTVEDAEDAAHEEGRAAHEHEGELHGCILLAATTPHANEQVHGDEGYLVEHEHGEHVDRDEEAEHTEAQQGEPKEVLLGEGLELPRGKGAREDDDGRKQQHGYRDAVDAYGILDVQGGEPVERGGVEHFTLNACGTVGQEDVGKVDRQSQQSRTTGHHDGTHSLDIAGEPQSEQHDQRYENE